MASCLGGVAEEVVEVGQLERVLLAFPDPRLQVFELPRKLLVIRLLVLEQGLLVELMVIHQISADSLGDIDILFKSPLLLRL